MKKKKEMEKEEKNIFQSGFRKPRQNAGGAEVAGPEAFRASVT